MKKFIFSLEKVLSLREFEEKQAKIELGIAVGEYERIKQNLENIAIERVKKNNARANSSDIIYLQSIENYINGLDAKKEQLLLDLAQAELIMEQKRELMSQAMTNRKIVSKLKEKQQEEYNIEKKREENKNLDEIKNKKAD